jgi:hypothetical protein
MARRLGLVVLVASLLALLGAAPSLAGPDTGAAVSNNMSRDDFAKGPGKDQSDWDVQKHASGGMTQILAEALEGLSGYETKDPCKGTAASAAWYALADAWYGGPLNGFLDAIMDALGKIKDIATFGADSEAAAEMVDAGKLADQYIDTLKDEGKDAVKEKLKEIWNGKKKEVFEQSEDKGDCQTYLIAIWDREAGTYDITIYGHCKCKPGPAPKSGRAMQLGAFAVRLTGVVEPDKVNGKWVYKVGQAKVDVSANCVTCTTGKPATYTGPGTTPATPPPPTEPPPPTTLDGWKKVTTNCKACQPIVDQINELVQRREALAEEQNQAQTELEQARTAIAGEGGDKELGIAPATQAQKDAHQKALQAATDKMEALRVKEGALIMLLQQRWAQLKACEKEKCGSYSMSCPPRPLEQAFVLGPNRDLGSGARNRQKAVSTAVGMLGGLLGGGGGGGGGGSDGPQLASCRIKDSEMTVFSDPQSGIDLKVGAKRSGDKVMVFADLAKSPDSGTFQTAMLERPDGQTLAPEDAQICQLWGEWSLTVSWTRTTYVDNQVVKRESGGWSRSGDFSLPGEGAAGASASLWKRLGFSNASHGAREVALTYKAPAASLASEPVDLVMHVTRPGQDPVTTQPFVLRVDEDAKGFHFARESAGTTCPQAAEAGAG